MHSLRQCPMLSATMGRDSMSFCVPQKAVPRKYGVTWTQKTQNQEATYENMRNNVRDQKQLTKQTESKMLRLLARL